MKSERKRRQTSETRITALEAENAALKKTPAPAIDPEYDEEGKEINPDDKPVTMKLLREERAREAKTQLAVEDEQRGQTERINSAVRDQEEYAKTVYGAEKFDDAMDKANALLKDPSLVSEPWKQAKLKGLFKELQRAHADADKLGVEDYTAAHIGVEIGQLHPEYGKEPKKTGDVSDPKANGGLSPEAMKRIEKNAQRKPSSASVSAGGGVRTVAPQDVTAQMLVNMSSAKRMAFRDKYPDIYSKVVHG